MSDNQHQETGKLIMRGDVQTFPSGFTKRQFVIDTGGDYPQQIPFELVKDKTSIADHWMLGDMLEVHFNVRGNEYNGKYYCNLQAWKVAKIGSEGGNQQYQQQYQQQQQSQSQGGYGNAGNGADQNANDGDGIPF